MHFLQNGRVAISDTATQTKSVASCRRGRLGSAAAAASAADAPQIATEVAAMAANHGGMRNNRPSAHAAAKTAAMQATTVATVGQPSVASCESVTRNASSAMPTRRTGRAAKSKPARHFAPRRVCASSRPSPSAAIMSGQ